MKKDVIKRLLSLLGYAWLMLFIVAVIGGIVLAVRADPGEYLFPLSVFLNVFYAAFIFYIHYKVSDMRSQLNTLDERISRIEKFLASRGKKVAVEVKDDGGK